MLTLALGATPALAAGSSQSLLTPPSSTPLSPGLPAPQATTPATASTPAPVVVPTGTQATAGSSSFSGTDAILVVVGALVVLAGISFFIWRDARHRAPDKHRPATALAGDGRSKPGSKRQQKPRKLSAAERKRRKRGRAR